MGIVSDILLIASIIMLIVMISISSRYLIKERELERRIRESSEIIGQIITELKDRLSKQDSNIMNQEVKLEILDMRVTRFLKELPNDKIIVQQGPKVSLPASQIATTSIINEQEKLVDIGGLTITEREVLRHLSNQESLTVKELQRLVGVSREHTARLLKKLFEAGYVKRSEVKRPYVYYLTGGRMSTFG